MEQKNNINSDFRVISKLGEGSFAEVFKVKNPKTQQVYAIKRLKKRYRSIEEVNKLPEILYLRALQNHPNIIKLHDVMFDTSNGYVALVFELMEMNLYELVRDNQKPYDEKTSLLLVYQLLKAIQFMHSKNLFHRDIKPENCMVNKKTLEMKLCDFGSTRQATFNGPYTEYVSTRWYRAPECILTSGSYGSEVDLWAVGCMLYELVTSRPLFPGKHEIDQISRIHNIIGTPSRDILAQFQKNPNTQISMAFPPRHAQDFHSLLPNATDNLVDLLQNLLVYNPTERLSADEAINHPVFDYYRMVDQRWESSGCRVPYAEYFDQVQFATSGNVGGFVLDTGKTSNLGEPKPLDNPDEFIIKSKPSLPPQPILKSVHPPILVPHHKPKPKPAMHATMDFNPIDEKLKALARIKEYNQKQMEAEKKRKQQMQQFQFISANVPKPSFAFPPYQNPKPELIKPRLPKLNQI